VVTSGTERTENGFAFFVKSDKCPDTSPEARTVLFHDFFPRYISSSEFSIEDEIVAEKVSALVTTSIPESFAGSFTQKSGTLKGD